MAVNMKSMIADAFMTLSKTKDVDKITVTDLVKACHISRQTFYYHFQDILEVLEWSVQQAFQEILAHSMDTEGPEDTLRSFIESSSEADALLKKLLHSQRREQIETILVNAVRSYLQEVLNRQDSKPDLPLAEAKIMLDFCTYGIVGLLLENCGKKSLDKEKMAHQMQRLIFDRIDMLKEKE
ncbi:TetR/AcrR family transcriptional regulator C-terminal domain-containing protein [uncultured Oscillibacter sp.]|uniref:TetR/AcrR family transcriptional regulator C-terminal domain-containing protein n=1 Tax=uncultured Oscillibacter sp. TaxID=876091 RepID=UPI002616B87A|nr:TetR/AcrR family transcriptional regulator C-terminal domain-containing protein [uncultured Oscillibacter sp.]